MASSGITTLPFAGLEVNTPGYGAMGLSQSYGPASEEERETTLAKALDIGCTFLDTAVVYGCGHNEQLIGDFLKAHNARDKVFLATKVGFEVDWENKKPAGRVNNSAKHIHEYFEGSLKRLQTTPDLLYLHRMDPDTPLEESIGTLDELRKAGKTKYIGLSECSVATLRKANAIAHIDAVQAEYSPFCTEHEGPGGLKETCKELGVAFVAYSPLGRGFLTGRYNSPDDFDKDDFRRTLPRYQGDNFYKNLKIVKSLQQLAEKKGVTPGQLALAWIASQGAIAIPGTKSPERLVENFGAAKIHLSESELKELREVIDSAKPEGERYSGLHMKLVGK